MTHINEARELLIKHTDTLVKSDGAMYHTVQTSEALAAITEALTASQEQQHMIEMLRTNNRDLGTEYNVLLDKADRTLRDCLRLEEKHEKVTAERDRYKAALDKADNLFMDNGTISAAEYKIIETGKAIRQALSPEQGGE